MRKFPICFPYRMKSMRRLTKCHQHLSRHFVSKIPIFEIRFWPN